MKQPLQHLIQKYSEGIISLKEQIELSEQLADPANSDAEEMLLDDWKFRLESNPNSDRDLKPILDRVHHRIRLNEADQPAKIKWFQTFQRVAAILIFPLLFSFLAYFYFQGNPSASSVSYAEIQCPMGVRTKFQLPDGSTGFLNSGSSLKYPLQFTNGRSVNLSGEAFFDVIPNKKSPFHVITSNLDIKVVGTKFNVAAFNNEGYEEVTIQEGQVEINNANKKSLASLEPNQQFNYNCTTQKYSLDSVDAMQYLSWTEGKLSFRDENFIQVSKRLSRWYKVDIEIGDKRLNNYIYYATFENEKLEDVLKLIEMTAPIICQVQEREKKPDGSFTVKKVVFTYSEEKQKQFK